MARATVELQARQGALGLGAAQDQPERLPDLLDASPSGQRASHGRRS
jgi:hypothetical protein